MKTLWAGLLVVVGLLSGGWAAAQTPSASPGPSTLPGPSASPGADVAWSAVVAPVFGTLDAVEAIAATTSELIAIGSRCDAQGSCERTVLASADGASWVERGRLPRDVDLLAALVADGDDLYVVGDRAGGEAAIWRSVDDGATWRRVGGRAAFRPGADGRPSRSPEGEPYEASVLAIATGPAGLVAGGWLNAEDLDRSAIWLSSDGMAWERVRLPRTMDRAGGVIDVAGGAGGWVALTAEGPWRSADGRGWSPVAGLEATEVHPTAIESTEAGYVAVGIGEGTAASWMIGMDGSAWRRLPDDPGLEALWEAELRAQGPRVVAVGTRDGDEHAPTVWLLEDAGWTAEPIPAATGAEPLDAAWIGDDLVVVGTVPATDARPTGAAWRWAVDLAHPG